MGWGRSGSKETPAPEPQFTSHADQAAYMNYTTAHGAVVAPDGFVKQPIGTDPTEKDQWRH